MKGFRTIILAVAVTAVGAVQATDFVQLIPDDPQTVGWIMTGLGVAMALLRQLTTTPLFKPEADG